MAEARFDLKTEIDRSVKEDLEIYKTLAFYRDFNISDWDLIDSMLHTSVTNFAEILTERLNNARASDK